MTRATIANPFANVAAFYNSVVGPTLRRPSKADPAAQRAEDFVVFYQDAVRRYGEYGDQLKTLKLDEDLFENHGLSDFQVELRSQIIKVRDEVAEIGKLLTEAPVKPADPAGLDDYEEALEVFTATHGESLQKHLNSLHAANTSAAELLSTSHAPIFLRHEELDQARRFGAMALALHREMVSKLRLSPSSVASHHLGVINESSHYQTAFQQSDTLDNITETVTQHYLDEKGYMHTDTFSTAELTGPKGLELASEIDQLEAELAALEGRPAPTGKTRPFELSTAEIVEEVEKHARGGMEAGYQGKQKGLPVRYEVHENGSVNIIYPDAQVQRLMRGYLGQADIKRKEERVEDLKARIADIKQTHGGRPTVRARVDDDDDAAAAAAPSGAPRMGMRPSGADDG